MFHYVPPMLASEPQITQEKKRKPSTEREQLQNVNENHNFL